MKKINPFKEHKLLHNAKVNFISEEILADKDDCEIIIKYIEKFKNEGLSKRGKTWGEQKDKKKQKNWKLCDDIMIGNDFMDDKNEEFVTTFHKIWAKIHDYVQYYIIHVGAGDISNVGITYNEWAKIIDCYNHPRIFYESPKLRKYNTKKDAYNKAHFDRSIGDSSRFSAGILYLNTIDEGGETVFPIYKKEIKPIQGKFVMFPSSFTHIHYSKPTKNQDRYNIIVHTKEKKY
jgi:hypothetical protein